MIVAGRYRLDEVLGSGGMATVYRARALALDEDVALKLLREELTANRKAVARFAREARAASRIDHPSVVRVIDFGFAADQGFYFLVMEHLQGTSLEERLERGPLGIISALHVLSQIASGMARAHELGVIHRDLKPDNVVLTQRGGRSDHAKVVDFGLSRLSESNEAAVTRIGEVIGTPVYMAPEQWQGQPIDPRVDLYSFGVLAYQVVAGAPPFESENTMGLMLAHLQEVPLPLQSRRGGVPEPVIEVVHKCLQKARDDRPPDFKEVVFRLADAWADISGPPPQLSYVGGPSLPCGPDSAPTLLDPSHAPHVEGAASLSRELERLRGVRRRRLTELAGAIWPVSLPLAVRSLMDRVKRGETDVASRAEALALAHVEQQLARERLAAGAADLRLQLVDANLRNAGLSELVDDAQVWPVEHVERALVAHRRSEEQELSLLDERLRSAVRALSELEQGLSPIYEQLARHVHQAARSNEHVRDHVTAFGRVDGAIAALQMQLNAIPA